MTDTTLVTGGNGFLALHITRQLLEQGYAVRATVRSLSQGKVIKETLGGVATPHLERLTFAQADLMGDSGWAAAMKGVDSVMSVASPVFPGSGAGGKKYVPTDADMHAATDGTLRILRAAKDAHVGRVVMTGNFGAVGFSNKDLSRTTTENDWTDESERGLSPYEKSKLIAEKRAWDYVRQIGRQTAGSVSPLEFVTVNPVAMFGPALGHHVSGSFGILKNILNGSMVRIPNINLNVIDVRDAAALHVRALQSPNAPGSRFIASADGSISMPQIADLIRRERPERAAAVSQKRLPNTLVTLASPFSEEAREAHLMLSLSRKVSTQRAQDLLGWTPKHTNEEAVLSAVDSLRM